MALCACAVVLSRWQGWQVAWRFAGPWSSLLMMWSTSVALCVQCSELMRHVWWSRLRTARRMWGQSAGRRWRLVLVVQGMGLLRWGCDGWCVLTLAACLFGYGLGYAGLCCVPERSVVALCPVLGRWVYEVAVHAGAGHARVRPSLYHFGTAQPYLAANASAAALMPGPPWIHCAYASAYPSATLVCP
jgi:hypothetical protein